MVERRPHLKFSIHSILGNNSHSRRRFNKAELSLLLMGIVLNANSASNQVHLVCALSTFSLQLFYFKPWFPLFLMVSLVIRV